MKKFCLFLVISFVSALFLFADNTVINDADVVMMPEIPAEYMETPNQVEFISTTDTPTDMPHIKRKRVPSGKFNVGVSLGMNIHNGTFKDLQDKDLKLKTNFVALKINASYKLKSPVVIYGDFTVGFPKRMDLNGETHNSSHGANEPGATYYSLASKSFTSFNLGAAYIFKLRGFDILAGGGLHFDTFSWQEDFKTSDGDTGVDYLFKSRGINLHLEGQMVLSDTWILNAVISPSFSFSNNYDYSHYKNDIKDKSGDKDGGKANCDFCMSIGAMYRF